MTNNQRFISLLRGINVSGQKSIKMDSLRALYQTLGFTNIKSYIQSGNLIFDAPHNDPPKIITAIEKAIEREFGFSVPVQLRTPLDLTSIIDHNPFAEFTEEANGTRVLVTFLAESPAPDKVELLQEYVSQPEKLTVLDRHVYLHCPNGYGISKLSNTFLESKLAVPATTRNWKTILKLHEMSA